MNLRHISPDGIIRRCCAKLGNCRFTQIDSTDRQFNQKEFKKITSQEPKIRQVLEPLANENKGTLTGLEFSTKSKQSTAEKILVRKKVKSMNEMWDLVRYTSLVDTNEYIDSFEKTIQGLKDKGFTIHQIKNTWKDKDNPYNGINVKVLDPDGCKFELQFHTKESLDAKEKAHLLYEKQRLLGKDEVKENLRLVKEMERIFNAVPNPYLDEKNKRRTV